jgi:exodeoxyribonuclease X
MPVFTVVDVETTGFDPANDALVEIAAVDVIDEQLHHLVRSALIRPSILIPPIAMAVHHITDLDVIRAGLARDVVPAILSSDDDNKIYVAHNAQFEKGFLEPYVPGSRWLCTWKAAKRVWPSLPGHKNQELRYLLNLPCERDIADRAHRAGPDAYVTAHLLCRLLREASVADMLRWTNEPVYMPVCPIGQDKGFKDKPWSEIDSGFLRWMIDKPIDNPDAIWWADQELKRRSTEADKVIAARLDSEKASREGYVIGALVALKMALNTEDLKKWWMDESEHRAKHRIELGTPEYRKLVDACADHKANLLKAANEQAA